jgi:hypothetical protein
VTVVHTLGYLLVAGVVAVVVYEKLGIRMLRTAWVHLDLVWSVALILTAVATPLFHRVRSWVPWNLCPCRPAWGISCSPGGPSS